MENDLDYYANSEILLDQLTSIGLKKSPTKVPSVPVSASTAQITGQFQLGLKNILDSPMLLLVSRANLTQPVHVKAVAELLLISGCRISEALNVNHNSILPDGQILLQGLKGSNSRLAAPILYREYWIEFKKSCRSTPVYYSRYYFYRLFKKYGISAKISSNKRASVTHLMRYSFINNLLTEGVDFSEIQQIIGHKSYKSTIHYINNLQNYAKENR